MPTESELVLVTGAGGMIGSATVAMLAAAAMPVRAHLGPPGFTGLRLPPQVPSESAEITDLPALERLCHSVTAIVHLAGPPSVAASFADPVGCTRAHVIGTATLLEAAQRAGVRRLVHISSAEIYGQVMTNPVAEDAIPAPRSPYGAAKLAAEALVRSACARGVLDVVVLRPFSVYGPHSPPGSLVGTVLAQARAGPAIEVRSLGTVRDYVHVDDVAAAAHAALTTGAGGVYNIGSGTGTSVVQLAAAAAAAAGRDLPVRATGEADRPGVSDLSALVADASAAARDLGWTARPLAAGLRQVLTAWDGVEPDTVD